MAMAAGQCLNEDRAKWKDVDIIGPFRYRRPAKGEIMRRRLRTAAVVCLLSYSSAACAGMPTRHLDGYSSAVGEKAAETAMLQVGRPYKFRGDSPAGFDCSGLVRYCYLAAGMNVPHGTEHLRMYTKPVSASELRKGDLLFFHESWKKYSHIGIYVGNNLFVHAPHTGKTVRTDSLLDPYYKKHLIEARRFY